MATELLQNTCKLYQPQNCHKVHKALNQASLLLTCEYLLQERALSYGGSYPGEMGACLY